MQRGTALLNVVWTILRRRVKSPPCCRVWRQLCDLRCCRRPAFIIYCEFNRWRHRAGHLATSVDYKQAQLYGRHLLGARVPPHFVVWYNTPHYWNGTKFGHSFLLSVTKIVYIERHILRPTCNNTSPLSAEASLDTPLWGAHRRTALPGIIAAGGEGWAKGNRYGNPLYDPKWRQWL